MASKKIPITLTEEQTEAIRQLTGKLGKSEAEVIRNIVIMWLFDNSFLSGKSQKKDKR